VRKVQRERFAGMGLTCNAHTLWGDMGPAEVRTFCAVDGAGKALLRAAMQCPCTTRVP
jgi:hypothetical protein